MGTVGARLAYLIRNSVRSPAALLGKVLARRTARARLAARLHTIRDAPIRIVEIRRALPRDVLPRAADATIHTNWWVIPLGARAAADARLVVPARITDDLVTLEACMDTCMPVSDDKATILSPRAAGTDPAFTDWIKGRSRLPCLALQGLAAAPLDVQRNCCTWHAQHGYK